METTCQASEVEIDRTEWFPGTVPPEREGFYERRWGKIGPVYFAEFNGKEWAKAFVGLKYVQSRRFDRSPFQLSNDTEWRGVTEKSFYDITVPPCAS